METWNRNNFNLEEFKTGKILIHCNTKEKANDLVKYLDKIGITWDKEISLLDCNRWNYFKENTCYVFYYYGLCFIDYVFYKNEDYTIIEWEIFNTNKNNKELLQQLLIALDTEIKSTINSADNKEIVLNNMKNMNKILDRIKEELEIEF